jgi:putative transposase
MTAQLAGDALANTVALRRPTGTVVHSDRGSQFWSHAYVHQLGAYGQHGSVGRVGACRQRSDGIVLLVAAKGRSQPPPVDHRGQLRLAIITWIERTYHRRQRQDRLGRLSPVEFEILSKAAHAA